MRPVVPAANTDGGSSVEGLRDMRRKRIERPRRSGRAGRTTDDGYAPYEALDPRDPRDPDIVRAKRLLEARRGEAHRPWKHPRNS